jgi:vesicle coat complex subunit
MHSYYAVVLAFHTFTSLQLLIILSDLLQSVLETDEILSFLSDHSKYLVGHFNKFYRMSMNIEFQETDSQLRDLTLKLLVRFYFLI